MDNEISIPLICHSHLHLAKVNNSSSRSFLSSVSSSPKSSGGIVSPPLLPKQTLLASMRTNAFHGDKTCFNNCLLCSQCRGKVSAFASFHRFRFGFFLWYFSFPFPRFPSALQPPPHPLCFSRVVKNKSLADTYRDGEPSFSTSAWWEWKMCLIHAPRTAKTYKNLKRHKFKLFFLSLWMCTYCAALFVGKVRTGVGM